MTARILTFSLALTGVTQAQNAPKIDFEKDIKPILEYNCITCHNPGTKKKTKLFLTTRKDAFETGNDAPSIKPGKPNESSLYTRMNLPTDNEDVMPPAKNGGPLPKDEIAKVRAWIEQGAVWPEGVGPLKARTRSEVDRPPSPDNLELLKQIRDHIAATSKEQAEKEMNAYEGKVPKTGVPYHMVPIPGGEFLMGSPETEKDRQPDEGPQVKAKIDPFWMGKYEVTWDEYLPFMVTPVDRYKDGAKKVRASSDGMVDAVSMPTTPYTEMSFGMGTNGFPAISMTQHAANKYCQWLSAQTGHFYRLPTEAEWEYACRAGTTTAYSFGDDPKKLGDYAWYFDNSNEKYQKVGKKKPNPWGLFDMHGNVVEWTLDQFDPNFYKSLQGGIADNPRNPVTLPYPHTVRGGSWDDDPKALRSAARRGSKKEWKKTDPQLPKSMWYHTDAQWLGFRVVRPLKIPTVEEMDKAWNNGVSKREE